MAGTPPYFNNAYGEYCYLRPGQHVFRVPDEVSDTAAAPANCALSQVVYSLQRAGFRFGQTLVVQGAGGLGLSAVAVARDMGAERIVVLDRLAERLELARAFGADHALSLEDLPEPERRVEAVLELTGGFGADMVADFVGHPEVIAEGLRMVRGNVRLVAASNDSPWALGQALAFLRRNARRFPFDRLVSHTFPLERISEAFRQADWRQRAGGPLRVSRAAIGMHGA